MLNWSILTGDVRETLKSLPDGCVQTCVTSPPYWGLRDYGTAAWSGGDSSCEHKSGRFERGGLSSKQASNSGSRGDEAKRECECGATRIDSQLGLEATPEAYVASLVAVFTEVRRVLADDGTVWLNLGDSYNAYNGGAGPSSSISAGAATSERPQLATGYGLRFKGLKPKDLVGIPWSVAKALQAPQYTGSIQAERDRVWLAAIIDGEGTICGFTHERKDDGRVRTGAHVFITNSSTALLDEAQRIWPASRSEHMSESEGHLGKRDVFRWIPHGAERKAQLLAELYPYLIVKRKQALIAWNLLQFVVDGKRLGRGEHGPAVREKRAHLAKLLGDANAGRIVDIPGWCEEPPSLFSPGWYLRSDVIWSKPNPMPESVTDRPTKAHEYIFLLSKSPRYYYDAEAISERSSEDSGWARQRSSGQNTWAYNDSPERIAQTSQRIKASTFGTTGQRNKRSVWHVATQPYPEAHFATYPEALITPCILAGSSEKGQCPQCAKPWVPVVERDDDGTRQPSSTGAVAMGHDHRGPTAVSRAGEAKTSRTTGWEPSCTCNAGEPIPQTVLDPFCGSGTTGAVAIRHQRSFIGCELNPEYVTLAEKRIGAVAPLFAEKTA